MFSDRHLEDDSDQEPNTILRNSRMPRRTRRHRHHKGDRSDKGEALVDSILKQVIDKKWPNKWNSPEGKERRLVVLRFNCGGDHYVRDCHQASDDEKRNMVTNFRNKKLKVRARIDAIENLVSYATIAYEKTLQCSLLPFAVAQWKH